MVGRTDGTVAEKGFKIICRPTPLQTSAQERQEIARLSEEQRNVSRSAPRATAQRGRQTPAEAAEDYAGLPDEHDDEDDAEDAARPPGFIRWLDPVSETYAQRLQRNETGWQAIQDALVIKSIEAKPANAALRLRQLAQLKQSLQDAACTDQQCPHCHQALQQQESRTVSYWGPCGYIDLQLPALLCSSCNDLWESVPVTYDSFGNAPKHPSVLLSSDVLELFRLLSKKGLSATDFCAAQTDLQAQRESACGLNPSGD